MRYRFYFTRQGGQRPLEIDCGRWEFHPKAKRRLIVWPSRRSRLSVDVFLANRVVMVKDDHGRVVWPTAASVIAKARAKLPSIGVVQGDPK